MKQYFIHQKITVFANQYRVYEDTPEKLVAFAHQKRLAIREHIAFFTGEDKKQPLFYLQARNIMELAGVYDVLDESGQVIGTLRKQFGASLLRSTWHLCKANEEQPVAVVTERSLPLAIFRRLWGLLPYIGDLPFFLKYHFDFLDPASKQPLGTYEKITLLRDHYKLSAEQQLLDQLDWRVLAAQGVALDALQSR